MKHAVWHFIVFASLVFGVKASQAEPTTQLPAGPIKIVVPFAPGGGVDNAARLLAKQLQADTGKVVIVENKSGGSGTIGGLTVKNSAPNGQTLLFSASTHVLAKQVLKKSPYDPVAEFAPVARVAQAPLLVVISPNLPFNKISDVVNNIQSHNDKWTAAIPAYGSASHIGTLLLA